MCAVHVVCALLCVCLCVHARAISIHPLHAPYEYVVFMHVFVFCMSIIYPPLTHVSPTDFGCKQTLGLYMHADCAMHADCVMQRLALTECQNFPKACTCKVPSVQHCGHRS
jgi:hypothetical protein